MNKNRTVAMTLALLGAGMVAGSALNAPDSAWGEVRSAPAPPAFQSGGQQSVPILKEIAATLATMDARLARLEGLAKQMHGQGSLRPAVK
jgi:hypothetical protein